MKSTTNPKETLKAFLYKTTSQTTTMTFGIRQQDGAAKRYLDETGLKFQKRGLTVNKDLPSGQSN